MLIRVCTVSELTKTPGRSTSMLCTGSARCVVLDLVDLAVSWLAATSATAKPFQVRDGVTVVHMEHA